MKIVRCFIVLPFVALLLLAASGLIAPSLALEVPPLTGRVNDLAHVLSPGSVRLLDHSLQVLEQSDSTQIVVLTIPSLDGAVLEEYALKVAETWKIGQKGVDNGALLLIAVNDRKVRIESGYGLEGRLTDLVAGRIIREKIVPAFRRGAFDQGVIDGVSAMIAAVKGEYAGKGDSTRRSGQQDPGGFLVFLVVGLFFIGNVFKWKRPLAIGLGGVFAPVLAAALFSGLFGWLITVLLIPVGMLGAFIASILAGTSGIHRSGGIFPGFGGGSFRGGGGFSGGGGGFGGGGASGGW
ncbi:YgcG family protein [Desulfobulbus sp.]|uniref:TPM domain-containing protein n=1 Tax=Desulfobulbus sp. TaxID=895 RepID=UPI0027BA2A35|nr:TPM domain-containing protein [Desulfobulbus sp.]